MKMNETFLLNMGSTKTLDYLNLILGTNLHLIGFIFNLISFQAFRKIKFSNNILKCYLKIYTFSSMVSCFFFTFSFISKTPRIIPNLSLTYWASFYRCKILPWNLTLYFFINTLDCLILFERISFFKSKLKKYVLKNPYIVCLVMFIFCNIFNFTNVLVEEPRSQLEYMKASKNFSTNNYFEYCKRNELISNIYWKILAFFIFLFKNVIMLIFELTLNIYSIILFRRYIKEKKEYFLLFMIDDENNKSKSTSSNNNEDEADIISPFHIMTSFNSKLTKMTIYLSFCTLLEQISFLIACLKFFKGKDNDIILTNYIHLVLKIFLSLKYISNIFVFYHFNKNFRRYLKKSFLIHKNPK